MFQLLPCPVLVPHTELCTTVPLSCHTCSYHEALDAAKESGDILPDPPEWFGLSQVLAVYEKILSLITDKV